ncbi:MAG: mechanosensitive ion channel family protein [Cellulophaga sp.]
MTDFFLEYQGELLRTLITLIGLIIVKLVSTKTIRRVGRISNIKEGRTRLIVKYVSGGITVLSIVAFILIWGVDIKELGIIFSSAFAMLGVVLFAQWSILSNVTAGVILFFSFPYKIGDRIKIMDKELSADEEYLIEDIKAFHVHLRKNNGELLTYPNNLMLQKAVSLVYID